MRRNESSAGEFGAWMTVVKLKGLILCGERRVSGRGRARVVAEIPRNALSCQGMFEPYLKSFYIRSTDPTQIKILKVSAGQRVWPLLPELLVEYQLG